MCYPLSLPDGVFWPDWPGGPWPPTQKNPNPELGWGFFGVGVGVSLEWTQVYPCQSLGALQNGSGDDPHHTWCYIHILLINTNSMICIFDINGGNWWRACSLSLTASNVSSSAAKRGVHTGARRAGGCLPALGFWERGIIMQQECWLSPHKSSPPKFMKAISCHCFSLSLQEFSSLCNSWGSQPCIFSHYRIDPPSIAISLHTLVFSGSWPCIFSATIWSLTLCNIDTQNNKWPLCGDLGPCLWHCWDLVRRAELSLKKSATKLAIIK